MYPKTLLTAAALGVLVMNLPAATIINSTQTFVQIDGGRYDPDAAVAYSDPSYSETSLTSAFGDATFTAFGKASADYGVLKTYVTGSLTNYAPQSYYEDCPPNACSVSTYGQPAYADASFTDTFTITGGSGIGYLILRMRVDGSDAQSGPNSVANGAAAVYDSSHRYLDTGFHGDTTLRTSAIQFTYGLPFSLTFEGVSQWVVSDEDTIGEYDGSGTADYFDTFLFDDFTVYSDAGGANQVPFSISSTSLTTYDTSQPSSSVPEPGTWILLSAGVLGLAGRNGLVRVKRI